MLQIHQATISELDKVTSLFEQYRNFYQKPADQQGASNFILNRLKNHDSVILLAEFEDKAAGFVQLYPSFSSTALQAMWTLNDLFVCPDFRQHQVGTGLMNAAKDYAIKSKSHSLKLCTAVDNHQAQALYQKLGYNKVTNFEHYVLML